MKLDVHSDLKIEHKVDVEKRHEFKFIGNSKYRKNLKMYAYNVDLDNIYEVVIEKREAVMYTSKKKTANYKAVLNPRHYHFYAFNLENAERKVRNFKIKQNILQ